MKQITKYTRLKQGDKIYNPVEVDGIVYWVGRDLVNVNSNTIPNYCPNSNQVFVGYFEANDDELYQNKGKVHPKEIIAQSQPKLNNVPVINLDSYIKGLAIKKFPYTNEGDLEDTIDNAKRNIWKDGYNSNPNQYSRILYPK